MICPCCLFIPLHVFLTVFIFSFFLLSMKESPAMKLPNTKLVSLVEGSCGAFTSRGPVWLGLATEPGRVEVAKLCPPPPSRTATRHNTPQWKWILICLVIFCYVLKYFQNVTFKLLTSAFDNMFVQSRIRREPSVTLKIFMGSEAECGG